jgi:thioredoxin-related protein
MTAKQWADHLSLTYFPSLVLLDERKQERFRIDSYVQAFHFQAALEYVDQKIYQREPEFQRYINERADNLRKTEKKVVITE